MQLTLAQTERLAALRAKNPDTLTDKERERLAVLVGVEKQVTDAQKAAADAAAAAEKKAKKDTSTKSGN